jgi:hypothetical protein
LADHGEDLIAELKAASEWPLKRERGYRETVARRRALRRGERDQLKLMSNWSQHTADGVDRDYKIDPLAKRIVSGFADFLFGEDPTFTDERHQEDLDEVVSENDLAARLYRAERMVASEGESFWKLHTNPEIAQVALIEWRSRLGVCPSFYGDRLLAVAFHTVVARESSGDEENPQETTWRHLEVHSDKVVRNLLFKGTPNELGDLHPLELRPETNGLPEAWNHGLPMLAGRVVNDLDDDDSLGEGEYDQVEDLLLALNEAVTIATENARLTGKDRIFAAERFTKQGGFDASMEVFTVDAAGTTLGEGEDKPAIYAVEKTYDADPLWLHIGKLVHMTLSRVGLVAKFIGDAETGGSDASGRAIRLQFIPTVNAARGKGREWDGKLPKIVGLMLAVGALPKDNFGFGRTYDPESLPSVARGDVLPVDEGETVSDNAVAVTAEIRSRWTAVKEQHPEWDDTEVQDELDRIDGDTAPPEMPPPPPPPGDE